MSGWRGWIVPGTVVLALAALVTLGWSQRERYRPLAEGDLAPDYAAPTLDGDDLALAELRGRVVLLNVWATWCPPCRTEMPSLQRLQEQLGPAGLEVVTVSVDAMAGGVEALRGERSPVRAFIDEIGLSLPVLLDPEGVVEDRFGVAGLPTTILIGRDGRIRGRVLGGREWDQGADAGRVRALLEE